jgi:hypothetical protein
MGMGAGATSRKVEIDYPKKTETENRVFKISWNRNRGKNTLEPSDHEIDTKILKTM